MIFGANQTPDRVRSIPEAPRAPATLIFIEKRGLNRTPETSKYQRFLWEIQHFDTHIHICEKKGCRVPSGNNKNRSEQGLGDTSPFQPMGKSKARGPYEKLLEPLEKHTFRGGGPQLRPARFPCTPRGNPANNENLRFLLYV